MFWVISTVFLALAALFVLLPLWKHYRPSADSEEIRTVTNLTIFEERRRELQSELDQGTLDSDQFEALLLELKKSLLSDTVKAGDPGSADNGKKPSKAQAGNETLNRVIPLIMVMLIPVVAFLMYSQSGYLSDVQLMPLYEQSISSDNDSEQARDLVIELGRVVQEDETNQWAWYFLGRNFSNLGMFNEAEIAFQRSSDLMPDGPDKAATLGLLAQIKYLISGGELNDEVLAVIEQARSINPSENASLQLLSVDAEMKGDLQSAVGYWRLMIQSNPNSAMARDLRQRITDAQRLIAQQGGTEVAAGPSIEVSISLAEGLILPAGLRLFVAARNAEQEGTPPLAATDLMADDLPTTVTLDNSMAITPMFNLSSADTIYVTATVSLTGSATVQSGDYRAVSDSFSHENQHSSVELVISDIVR